MTLHLGERGVASKQNIYGHGKTNRDIEDIAGLTRGVRLHLKPIYPHSYQSTG